MNRVMVNYISTWLWIDNAYACLHSKNSKSHNICQSLRQKAYQSSCRSEGRDVNVNLKCLNTCQLPSMSECMSVDGPKHRSGCCTYQKKRVSLRRINVKLHVNCLVGWNVRMFEFQGEEYLYNIINRPEWGNPLCRVLAIWVWIYNPWQKSDGLLYIADHEPFTFFDHYESLVIKCWQSITVI